MNSELGYIVLPVADGEQGKRFYGELFGWKFAEPGSVGGYHILNANFPGAVLPGTGDTRPQLYFVVPDIAAGVARVRELGGQADEPTGSEAWLTARCRDDQGSEFWLWQQVAGYEDADWRMRNE